MENRQQWIRENISEALKNREFEAWYQPIVRTVSGAVSNYEALARWRSPQLGLVHPTEFIPILEELNMNAQLDEMMLCNVLTDIQKLMIEGRDVPPMSVNLSQTDFKDESVVDRLIVLVNLSQVPHDKIIFEITESACVDSPAVLKDAIRKFHNAGFSVWMDDFGSGYSSLNALSQYDFDLIKSDMCFLKSFNSGGKSATVLGHVLSMTQDLHIMTLVEGVENLEHVNFLKKLSCDRMQGYLFQKPAPIEYYKHQAKVNPDFPFFSGEKKQEAQYYDSIRFKEPGPATMPEELARYMKIPAQATLELTGTDFRLLFSNEEFLEFMAGHGVRKDCFSNSSFRKLWAAEAGPVVRSIVETSRRNHSWEMFADELNGAKVMGWLYAIDEDPSRGAISFKVVFPQQFHT